MDTQAFFNIILLLKRVCLGDSVLEIFTIVRLFGLTDGKRMATVDMQIVCCC